MNLDMIFGVFSLSFGVVVSIVAALDPDVPSKIGFFSVGVLLMIMGSLFISRGMEVEK